MACTCQLRHGRRREIGVSCDRGIWVWRWFWENAAGGRGE
jgi:hypothetical protein